MSAKFDEAIKVLVEEGRSNGGLTFAEMSRLLEDQFIPPDQLDQVFVALEEAGVEVVDDNEDPVRIGVSRGFRHPRHHAPGPLHPQLPTPGPTRAHQHQTPSPR